MDHDTAASQRPDRELARARTKWAEDRTVLANERTFSGWARTGLTSLAVALGFRCKPTFTLRITEDGVRFLGH